MTLDLTKQPLTDEQKKSICTLVASGCDRETAAKFARTTWAALHAVMSNDRDFAAEIRYREAIVEMNHMLHVHEAAKKEANWRASVWWLETMHPERYGPRGSSMVTAKQLKLYLEHVSTTLVVEVRNDEDRERLLAKLHETAQALELFLRDESFPDRSVTAASLLAESDATAADPPPTSEHSSAAADEDIE